MTYHSVDNLNVYNVNYDRTVRDRWRKNCLERRLAYEARWRKKKIDCPHCKLKISTMKWAAHMRTHRGFIKYPTAGQLVWQ